MRFSELPSSERSMAASSEYLHNFQDLGLHFSGDQIMLRANQQKIISKKDDLGDDSCKTTMQTKLFTKVITVLRTFSGQQNLVVCLRSWFWKKFTSWRPEGKPADVSQAALVIESYTVIRSNTNSPEARLECLQQSIIQSWTSRYRIIRWRLHELSTVNRYNRFARINKQGFMPEWLDCSSANLPKWTILI